jgi:hypothetical protein
MNMNVVWHVEAQTALVDQNSLKRITVISNLYLTGDKLLSYLASFPHRVLASQGKEQPESFKKKTKIVLSLKKIKLHRREIKIALKIRKITHVNTGWISELIVQNSCTDYSS